CVICCFCLNHRVHTKSATLSLHDALPSSEHMGPEQLHAHVEQMAEAHGARFDAVVGDDLLAQDFPAIHAVGRASHRAPRLLRLRSEEHTSELQSRENLVCRLLLEKKKYEE